MAAMCNFLMHITSADPTCQECVGDKEFEFCNAFRINNIPKDVNLLSNYPDKDLLRADLRIGDISQLQVSMFLKNKSPHKIKDNL
jgi:hypothetical protein